jgi:hypothetical protein
MHEYEIRVFGEGDSGVAVYHATHGSIAKAIGEARKIAAGQPFQVWRGQDCVFTVHLNQPSELTGSLPDSRDKQP